MHSFKNNFYFFAIIKYAIKQLMSFNSESFLFCLHSMKAKEDYFFKSCFLSYIARIRKAYTEMNFYYLLNLSVY
jgi:hypothetical protein